MSTTIAPQRLKKRPAEKRQYQMDMTALLGSSEKLSGTPTVTSERLDAGSSDLTLATKQLTSDGKSVTVVISGGTASRRYKVIFKSDTDANLIVEQAGILIVEK